MKRYKRYEESDYHLTYDNRKVIDSKHSLERYLDRNINIISDTIMKRIVRDVAKEIIEKYNDIKGEYGFHSKSTGVGGIVMWRRQNDPKKDDGKNHFIIKTTLPLKKFHHFNNVAASIIVEQQVILWAKEKGFTKQKNKYLVESFSEEHEYYEDDFYVSFFEGKLNEFKLDGYIIVD